MLQSILPDQNIVSQIYIKNMSDTQGSQNKKGAPLGQRYRFIPPKADALEKSKDGQGIVHELPYSRNWERAIDAIHWILEKKWYYIMIATNTRRGRTSKILKKGMNLDRQNKRLPEELQIVLKMQISTFEGLNSKIRETQLYEGSNKDVWHFKTQWKEFPEGTKIIVLHQSILRSILFNSHAQRKAFVMLDGKCKMAEQNLVLLAIRKVFTSKSYCEGILKRVAKARGDNIPKAPRSISKKETEEIIRKKEDSAKNERGPASLVILLLDRFDSQISDVTDNEFSYMFHYFNKLKEKQEFGMELKTLESRIRTYIEERELRKKIP